MSAHVYDYRATVHAIGYCAPLRMAGYDFAGSRVRRLESCRPYLVCLWRKPAHGRRQDEGLALARAALKAARAERLGRLVCSDTETEPSAVPAHESAADEPPQQTSQLES